MSAINYQFKMYLEGMLCPFESAVIRNSPNGVEMNIEVHPTDKLFDLAPKTHIAIFYLDEKTWRLLGEGYFSGFAKNDDAAGARTVSMICRDFRMDIRKTPAAFVFQPDDSKFDQLYLMNRYGLKRTFQTPDGSSKPITDRTHGGLLRPFNAVIDRLSKTAGGGVGDNGRFLLDAFTRSIWVESVAASTYGTFINSRIRADKRIAIPENLAGYRFFSKDYMDAFGQQVIFNNSMFSSVESVIMRMAAIFQSSPVSCSTPNLIALEQNSIVMADEIYDHLIKNPAAKFGSPYIMNSCMILPPMQFTAPPNCNILFPSLYNTVSWQHDYDSDITRAYFRVSEIFGGASELSFRTKEIPNSLMYYNKKGMDTPPLTIEERFKGSNIMESEVEMSVAKKSSMDSYAEDVMINPEKYKQAIAKSKSKNKDKLLALVSSISKDTDKTELKKAIEAADELGDNGIGKIITPTPNDIIERHALMKFLMTRFSSRIISVNAPLNPYIVCGFPAAVLADETMKYKTTRSIIGQVVTTTHTIHASGQASTNIVMNCCRFISEPTDIDEYGNPLFCPDTDPAKSTINQFTFDYLDTNKVGAEGYPYKNMKPAGDVSKILDWRQKGSTGENATGTKVRWAKDVITIVKPKDSNINFTDATYTPHKIAKFYQQIFGQNRRRHFMVGWNDNTPFMYDTIHEALENLSRNEDIKNDYFKATKFVHRKVISENDYFINILGLSFKIKVPKPDNAEQFDYFYTNNEEYLPRRDDDKWYGIPSNENYNIINLKKDYYLEYDEGQFGSIYEKSPVTAFLRERIEPARRYISEVNQRANSIR